MAKVSSIERNMKRQRLVAKYAGKRALLKDIARNKDLPVEERFALSLNSLPCRAIQRPTACVTGVRSLAVRAVIIVK